MRAIARPVLVRILLSIAGGVLAAVLLSIALSVHLAVIAGITVAELAFLLSSWLTVWPMDAAETRDHAGREDLRPAADAALVAGLSALAVGSILVLGLGASGAPASTGPGAALTLAGVFGAWACVHLTYAVRYAHLYYATDHGFSFGGEQEPRYSDFLYVSYGIGMTYGLTDVTSTDTRTRQIVLRHALVSFGFGMIVLGAAVNLVAGVLGLG